MLRYRLFLVTLALVCALVATVAWHFLLSGSSSEQLMVKVPVAAQNIPPMTVIEQQHLLFVEMSEKEVGKLNIITQQSEILGKRVFEAVDQKSPFLKSNIQSAESQAPFYLPTGYRAITIANSPLIGVAGFAKPGTYVDVFFTYGGENANKEKSTRTAVAFQNVKVLAVDTEGTPDAEGNTLETVTLMLKLHEAKYLTLMESVGKLKLVLRPSATEPIEGVQPPTIPDNPLPPADLSLIK